jgi:ankyrin repeat protein
MASALVQAGAHVKIVDREDQSPLHLAASSGNLSVLSMLLANGALCDGISSSVHNTPLT